MDSFAKVQVIPETLYLVTETPEIFEISINGVKIDKTVIGYFQDKSFKKIDVKKYFHEGDNIITYECEFGQSETFNNNLKKAFSCPSERNKLTYDMEIEAIYLLGDFGLRTDGQWSVLDKVAVRYTGDFVIDKPNRSVGLHNIERQGFPFFCGELSLEGEIDVQRDNPVLVLDFQGINAIRVENDQVKNG